MKTLAELKQSEEPIVTTSVSGAVWGVKQKMAATSSAASRPSGSLFVHSDPAPMTSGSGGSGGSGGDSNTGAGAGAGVAGGGGNSDKEVAAANSATAVRVVSSLLLSLVLSCYAQWS